MNGDAVPKRAHDLEITETADGIVIQNGDCIHLLNETAREIFRLCDGTRTVLEISQEIVQRYSGENIDKSVKETISNFLLLNIIQI